MTIISNGMLINEKINITMPVYLIINMCVCVAYFPDTKNSVGLVGCIEEVSHNAIAVYWNPLESSAKVRHILISRNLCTDTYKHL